MKKTTLVLVGLIGLPSVAVADTVYIDADIKDFAKLWVGGRFPSLSRRRWLLENRVLTRAVSDQESVLEALKNSPMVVNRHTMREREREIRILERSLGK